MPLLNYTTKIEAAKTARQIVDILAKHRATNIMMDYDGRGNVTGLKWRVDRDPAPVAFALPVNVEAVYQILTKQRVNLNDGGRRRKQAERTAWRNIKDWVEAQMALLESGQAEIEQIFLPYMLIGDQTVYEAIAEGGFKALPAARQGF